VATLKTIYSKLYSSMPDLKTGLKHSLLVLATFVVASCASVVSQQSNLYRDADWSILSIENQSNDANAHTNTVALIESNLRARGVRSIVSEDIADYGVKGIVKRWGSERLAGRDSKVSLELSVVNMASGETVWSAEDTGRAKGARSTSDTANRVVAKLVNGMALRSGADPVLAEAKRQAAINQASSDLSNGPGNSVATGALGFRRVALDNNGFTKAVSTEVVGKSVAIFYGAKPPAAELSQFDRLIVEPDNIDSAEFAQLAEHGATLYAYLSVGEIGPTRSYANEIGPGWVLGKNDVWNSKVLDLTNPEWTTFLTRRIDALVAAGYRGLFLDTMDSYQIYAKNDSARAMQEQALGDFIGSLKQRHPGLRLIANRGFEVLDTVGPYLEAVAAESLFASWDNTNQKYVDVPANDREWLLGKLNTAKQQFNLDVIAIEYLPPERREEARKVATKIAELGFTPWVSTPALDYVGVGLMEVIPRKVMMLFDSRVNGVQSGAEVHELVAPLLEYYGYVPEYVDVAKQALPGGELKGQFAGIVTWASQTYAVNGLSDWLLKQLNSDVPMAMFGVPVAPLNTQLSAKLGLSLNGSIHADSLKVTQKTKLMDYEKPIPARIEAIGANVKSISDENQVHLSLTDKQGVQADLVVTGPWGGMAVHPAAANVDFEDTYYWVTNPFPFLEKALRLQTVPMPDVTTENGKRIWTAHIDGDALPSWSEVPGRRLGAELIHDEILQPYNLPHTISIVEGEMTGIRAYTMQRPRMFSVAKQIFAMPSVEIATHTYSHPYAWDKIAGFPSSGRYNLAVGNYAFDAEREIMGSANFIDTKLAPPGKRTEVMLWSGNALPNEGTLATAYKSGLVNLNGGYTTINEAAPTVSRISPMARVVGQYVQPYAPIMNENVYTNDWRGPYDGFRRVIETFKMTDKPRRFKPLSIYYHFYAGTKRASLQSLHEIYEWSTKQDIFPVHASYYAKKVADFRNSTLSRYIDGSWKITGLGNVRSVRMLDTGIWPVSGGSRGIAGAKQLHDGVYIHTDGSDEIIFKTEAAGSTSNTGSALQLISANGVLESWENSGSGVRFRIVGQVPVKLELNRAASLCQVQVAGRTIRPQQSSDNTTIFTFTTKDTGNAILNCQA